MPLLMIIGVVLFSRCRDMPWHVSTGGGNIRRRSLLRYIRQRREPSSNRGAYFYISYAPHAQSGWLLFAPL